MTDLELNIALHEKVMGKCWHDELGEEWHQGEPEIACSKCRQIFPGNPSYTTNPADYWELLQKVKEKLEKLPRYEKKPDKKRRGRFTETSKDLEKETKWDEFISFLYGKAPRRKNIVCETIAIRTVESINVFLNMPRGCQAIWEFFCKEK